MTNRPISLVLYKVDLQMEKSSKTTIFAFRNRNTLYGRGIFHCFVVALIMLHDTLIRYM